MDTPAAHLDEEQHVQPLEPDRVDRAEMTRNTDHLTRGNSWLAAAKNHRSAGPNVGRWT
jgi:hypothetical protein